MMNVKKLAKPSIIAALYIVITVAIAPISYGALQLRLSEVLTLLAFVDSSYITGLVLGCAISNFWSPLGIVDVIVGAFATFLSVYMMSKSKNLFIASLCPTINCIFISLELYFIMDVPIWLSLGSIAVSEFIVVTCLGYPLFKFLLSNPKLDHLLRC